MTTILTDTGKVSEHRPFAAFRALFRELASIPAETQAHFARLKDAHSVQAQFAGLSGDITADIALPAEDVLGTPSYSEDLPFFMQAGFGRRG
jgi:hypothetical protein